MLPAYFTIKRAGVLRNKWRARFFGANHEQVWYTQPYKSRDAAYAAVAFLQSHANDAPVEEE